MQQIKNNSFIEATRTLATTFPTNEGHLAFAILALIIAVLTERLVKVSKSCKILQGEKEQADREYNKIKEKPEE